MYKKLGVIAIVVVVVFLTACYNSLNGESLEIFPETAVSEQVNNIEKSQSEDLRHSVFSWHDDVFELEKLGEVVSTLKNYNIGSIYQWFSSDVDDIDIINFITAMNDEDIKVYVLTGDPSWAKSKNIKKVYDVIDRANSLGNVSGVVLDIEPSGLDEYDDNKEEVMEEFAQNINLSYQYAKNYGFEVIVCTSANWDELPELRDIIKNSCDSVCVMNYFVDREYERILREAEYAKVYEKHLINASELQPPGDHGLTENNTYYGDGVEVVLEAWEQLAKLLDSELNFNDLSFSFHHYDSLVEISE